MKKFLRDSGLLPFRGVETAMGMADRMRFAEIRGREQWTGLEKGQQWDGNRPEGGQQGPEWEEACGRGKKRKVPARVSGNL